MDKTTTALETPLREQLDGLAAFEPTSAPVLSLYLDMRPDQQGRSNYDTFLRRTVTDRVSSLNGEARKSAERDIERITAHLASVERSTNGLAVFASAASNDFFQAIPLAVPIDEHQLFIGPVPHLYPLARLNDQYPRYAALLVDTNSARLFVFSLGVAESHERVQNAKTRRSMQGGWSQARYQRHLENFHLHHMKEVVAILDRVVREENINQIVVACDEVARPTLMEQLPKHLAEKIVDVVKLDIRTPEQQVLTETLEALRGKDAETDAEHVQRMLDAWRAGGLGVAGPAGVMAALEMGQVEELLIAGTPDQLRASTGTDKTALADNLVRKAQQTSARIRFIEDPELLNEVGGVGAILRFRIEAQPNEQTQQSQQK
jgi:peptide subunit release factor 1 (eRF1)